MARCFIILLPEWPFRIRRQRTLLFGDSTVTTGLGGVGVFIKVGVLASKSWWRIHSYFTDSASPSGLLDSSFAGATSFPVMLKFHFLEKLHEARSSIFFDNAWDSRTSGAPNKHFTGPVGREVGLDPVPWPPPVANGGRPSLLRNMLTTFGLLGASTTADGDMTAILFGVRSTN